MQDLRERTMDFAVRTLELSGSSPHNAGGWAVGNQVARSGTSVGANYRAAQRARSRKEFLAKLGTVEEEADETAFWLELTIRADLLPASRVQPLLDEANQLTAIMVTAKKTTRRRGV